MRTSLYAVALLLCGIVAPTAAASPPALALPITVTGVTGSFVTVPATTEGKIVAWYAIDPELNLFPVHLLKDTRTAVVTSGKPGTYRLLAITAVGDEVSVPIVCRVVIQQRLPATPKAESPKVEGVFFDDYLQPACGPNGCSYPVPGNFSQRRFRR